MDLVYIPDVLTFGSFRNPQYRDYEQPWNSNYFDDGKTYRQQQQQRHHQRDSSSSKESCSLCRENKRRSLAAYIRGKSRNKSCGEICEEEEEEEATAEEQSQTTGRNNKSKCSKA